MADYQTLHWEGDAASGCLVMIDQTLLPLECREIQIRSAEEVWEAFRSLRVRGAPAIGVTAGYGVVIGTQACRGEPLGKMKDAIEQICQYLATSRPTAVNLFWALDRIRSVVNATPNDLSSTQLHDLVLEEARRIDTEDREMCKAIGRHGSQLLKPGMRVLTHCNAGGLATAGDGTALSLMFAAAEAGREIEVYANETRPLLQGARLTAWELQQRKIPVTVICDSMAGQAMKEGLIDIVITGADRIASNGDTANKIGTYMVAILAQYHNIPFCVAAPSSTFDLTLASGGAIPIEQRPSGEITEGFGRVTCPPGARVYNPAFDVTPAEMITAFITEKGILYNPSVENIGAHLHR
ncbi:MAG: S-methyl-5-thioribose-1-phosphate isomerase [Planctomycetaceae bacterium]